MARKYTNVVDLDFPFCATEIAKSVYLKLNQATKNVLCCPLVGKELFNYRADFEKKNEQDAELERRFGMTYENIIVHPSIDNIDEFRKRIADRGREQGLECDYFASNIRATVNSIEKHSEMLDEFGFKRIVLKPKQYLESALIENGIPLEKPDPNKTIQRAISDMYREF